MNVKGKILVVDDSWLNVDLITELLTDHEYTTVAASSGIEAIEKVKKENFDLVLLDIMMPEMDGFDVFRQIKLLQASNNLPIIFLTARTDSKSLLNGFRLGAVDYIKKPFSQAELLSRVENHVELKKAKEKIQCELAQRKKVEEDLKNNLQFLEILVDTIPNPIYFKDKSGCYKGCNNTFAKTVFGVQKNEIIGKKVFDFQDILTPELAKLHYEKDMELLKTEKTQHFEEKVKCYNGVIRDFVFNKAVYLDTQKNVQGLVGVMTDITERKQLQSKILSTIIETEDKERNRFAKDLHDGLGALLSSINIYMNLIEQGKISVDELPVIVDTIKSLLNEAVTSSKEIANNIRPNMLNNFGLVASVNAFCEKLNTLGTIKVLFNSKNFSYKLEQNMEVMLWRIINELINNSLKHSSANRINIKLANSQNNLKLAYSDNGIGFDVQKALNTQSDSKGLQNIISRVNSINGKVKITSRPGNGVLVKIVVNF